MNLRKIQRVEREEINEDELGQKEHDEEEAINEKEEIVMPKSFSVESQCELVTINGMSDEEPL